MNKISNVFQAGTQNLAKFWTDSSTMQKTLLVGSAILVTGTVVYGGYRLWHRPVKAVCESANFAPILEAFNEKIAHITCRKELLEATRSALSQVAEHLGTLPQRTVPVSIDYFRKEIKSKIGPLFKLIDPIYLGISDYSRSHYDCLARLQPQEIGSRVVGDCARFVSEIATSHARPEFVIEALQVATSIVKAALLRATQLR